MISMATHIATLKNGTEPTKSTMSGLLLDLGYKTWYHMKAYAPAFHYIVRYANLMQIIKFEYS